MLFPSPGDLPNPGIEPRSPALRADALPSEPQGSLRDRQGECKGDESGWEVCEEQVEIGVSHSNGWPQGGVSEV